MPNRIENVQVLARPGIIPHPEIMAQAARYQIGGWICDAPPFEIQVRITGTHWLQAFKEAPPALPDFAARPAEDGQSAVVTFKANHPNGAIRWVLQFGACAQVLEPESLRARVREDLRRALEAYGD